MLLHGGPALRHLPPSFQGELLLLSNRLADGLDLAPRGFDDLRRRRKIGVGFLESVGLLDARLLERRQFGHGRRRAFHEDSRGGRQVFLLRQFLDGFLGPPAASARIFAVSRVEMILA